MSKTVKSEIDLTMDVYSSIYDEPEQVKVTVKFTFTPGHPGSRYARNGDPGDPPEPAELDITGVILREEHAGHPVGYDVLKDLNDLTYEKLDDAVWNKTGA